MLLVRAQVAGTLAGGLSPTHLPRHANRWPVEVYLHVHLPLLGLGNVHQHIMRCDRNVYLAVQRFRKGDFDATTLCLVPEKRIELAESASSPRTDLKQHLVGAPHFERLHQLTRALWHAFV